jgi:hypothetical protein
MISKLPSDICRVGSKAVVPVFSRFHAQIRLQDPKRSSLEKEKKPAPGPVAIPSDSEEVDRLFRLISTHHSRGAPSRPRSRPRQSERLSAITFSLRAAGGVSTARRGRPSGIGRAPNRSRLLRCPVWSSRFVSYLTRSFLASSSSTPTWALSIQE